MDSFTTEFGHTIPFVPVYFERNSGYAKYAKSTKLHEGLTVVDGAPMNPGSVLKNWAEFSSVVHFMAKAGVLRRFGNGVDLGGASSACIRMFKAAGFIEHATNVDLDDYSKLGGDAFFRECFQFLRAFDSTATPEMKEALQRAKNAFDTFSNVGLMDGIVSTLKRSPDLDSNLHMDLMETPGTYDLVTAFCCFDYLEINKALKKVRSLLNPGGVFVGVLEYWWWPINSTGILGHFPYAGARLSLDDLTKYYAEYHSDLIENLYFKYSYFHEGQQHPTINDWFAAAKENGLRPVAVERIMPSRHHRIPDTPYQIFSSPGFDHRDVLRDIHHLKPDVTVDDLYTSAIRLALTTD